MTIEKAVRLFDETRSNDVKPSLKNEWLSELDMKLFTEVFKPRGGSEFAGYTATTPPGTVLLAPEEYAEIYVSYLIMKLDYMNGEIGRYNNSSLVFNRLYYELVNYCNRKESVNKNTSIKAGKLYV